jgi:hypothetical protein
MKQEEKIFAQHAEHTEWRSKLKFYNDEISILRNRLSEIVSKNTNVEALKQVEHFENQLIIQKNNIDELNHLINVDEDKLTHEVVHNPVAVDHRKVHYHAEEKEAIDTFEKNFNELRNEFKVFASKLM